MCSLFYLQLHYIKDDAFYIKKTFSKTKRVDYSQIAYYSDAESTLGGVTCYSQYGIPLFEVSYMQVGIDKIKGILQSREVEIIPIKEAKTKFKGVKQFDLYRRKSTYKVCFGLLFVCGAVSLIIASAVVPHIDYREYSEDVIYGIVDTYELSGNSLTITLEDDDSVYSVDNVAYSKLDKTIFNVLGNSVVVNNNQIELSTGYADEYGRMYVCGIKFLGVEYLNPSAVREAEYSNYRGALTTCYVFIAIGAVLVVLSAVYFCMASKVKRQIVNVGKEL